jgi:hypothetical protein
MNCVSILLFYHSRWERGGSSKVGWTFQPRIPAYTYTDDTLQFRTGPQRERLRISYSEYKRFGVESTFKPRE